MRFTPACARTLKLPIRLHEGKTRTIVILRTAGFVSRKISVVPPFRRPGRTTVREARTGLRGAAPSQGSGGQLSAASVKGPTDPAAPPPAADVVPPVCVPPVAPELDWCQQARRSTRRRYWSARRRRAGARCRSGRDGSGRRRNGYRRRRRCRQVGGRWRRWKRWVEAAAEEAAAEAEGWVEAAAEEAAAEAEGWAEAAAEEAAAEAEGWAEAAAEEAAAGGGRGGAAAAAAGTPGSRRGCRRMHRQAPRGGARSLPSPRRSCCRIRQFNGCPQFVDTP